MYSLYQLTNVVVGKAWEIVGLRAGKPPCHHEVVRVGMVELET